MTKLARLSFLFNNKCVRKIEFINITIPSDCIGKVFRAKPKYVNYFFLKLNIILYFKWSLIILSIHHAKLNINFMNYDCC